MKLYIANQGQGRTPDEGANRWRRETEAAERLLKNSLRRIEGGKPKHSSVKLERELYLNARNLFR
jgi:hypothetical protein